MKSRSSQGRQENGNHIRKTRRELDLARHEGFSYVAVTFPVAPGDKLKAPHFAHMLLGYEIELRYSQLRELWTAKCPQFGIEIQFKHSKPNVIRARLYDWLLDYIEDVINPLPAVLEIAGRRDCTLDEAQVIFDDRASL